MINIIKNGIAFKAVPHGSFWGSVINNHWEPETFEIMQKYLDKNHSYLDIGAWIGSTVLFGAYFAKKVFAFEPDEVAFKELQANLDLNPELKEVVSIFQSGIAPQSGFAYLGTNSEFGDSMSSILMNRNKKKIITFSLGDILQRESMQDCNFIKMDIEGGEEVVIPAAKGILTELKPTLYLSLHVPRFITPKESLEKICDVLSVYKNIYSDKGKKISLDQIKEIQGFAAIIATDI